MKKLLIPAGILGGILLMSAAKKPSKTEETETLRQQLIAYAQPKLGESPEFDHWRSSLYKMTHDEVVALYRFLITYEGNTTFLPSALRTEIKAISDRYNVLK